MRGLPDLSAEKAVSLLVNTCMTKKMECIKHSIKNNQNTRIYPTNQGVGGAGFSAVVPAGFST